MISNWKQNSWSKSGRCGGHQSHKRREEVQPKMEPRKQRLLELMKNFVEEFAIDSSVDPWSNDRLWGIIANEMNDSYSDFTASKCKTEFSSLFGRYFFILKQKGVENAQKFPYFNLLHDDMKLEVFNKEIPALKEEFDKINREKLLEAAEKALNRSESTNADAITLTTASWSFEHSRKSKTLEEKDVIVDITEIARTKTKTWRSKFYIHDFESKEILVEAMKKWNHRFTIIAEEDIWDNLDPWNLVLTEIRAELPEYEICHCQAYFWQLFYQYKYIISRLPHWPHEKALQMWPFFRIFHTQMRLSCFWYSIEEMKKEFNSCPKTHDDTFSTKYYADNVIPRNFFYVHFADEKKKLLEKIKKYEEEFLAKYKLDENGWLCDGVWKNVANEMNLIVQKIDARKCKSDFVVLLEQYVAIVKDLSFLSVKDACGLFQHFAFFHNELNLTPFCANIKAYKKKFNDTCESTVASATSTVSSASSSSSAKQTSHDTKLPTKLPEEDEFKENIELVLAVKEREADFSDFSMSDDQIWLAVALDLKEFEPSAEEKGVKKWRDRFYELLTKFFKFQSASEEEKNNWLFYNQFESLNLNSFLDRWQNPIQSSKKQRTL